MCMRQDFKLLCCAAYILNLIVLVCLSCCPNLWCSGVFSAEFRSFRKNSTEPDISRKYGSASRIFWKIRLRGLEVTAFHRPIGGGEEFASPHFRCSASIFGSSRLIPSPDSLSLLLIYFGVLMKTAVAPEAVWQVERPPYQSEICMAAPYQSQMPVFRSF